MKIVWIYINTKDNKNKALKDKESFKLNKYFYIITIFILIKYLYFLRVTVWGNCNLDSVMDSLKANYITLYLGYILVGNSIFFLIKGESRLKYLFFIDLIVTIVIIFDVLYYRGFSDFLSIYSIKQSSNLEGLAASTAILLRKGDILFVVDIIILGLVLVYNKIRNSKPNKSISIFRGCFYCVMGLLIVMLGVHTDEFRERYNSWNKENRMLILGPVNYHIKDFTDAWFNGRYSLTTKDKQEIEKWYIDKENYVQDPWFGKFKGKNLIIIQIESLENCVINKKINGQEITPNINKIVSQSIYFNNYRESVHNGNSSDSDLMTNAGVYPVREGSVFFRFPANQYSQSLPKILGDEGYETNAVKACSGSFWNWRTSLKSIGFNECVDRNSFKNGEMIGFILSDRDYFNQILGNNQLFKEPFYNFFVTGSSHTPFKISEKYHEMVLPNNLKESPLGDYFQSIHYADKAIGEFLNKLKDKGILENSLVVLYGDHTGPEKYFYDKLGEIKDNAPWWLNNDKRIPLVMYSKGIKPEARTINSSQIDLLPTLLYLMGVKHEKYKMALGKNLFTSKNDFCILQNFSIIGNPNEKEKEHLKKGIILNDKMIRSDYFK